MQKSELVGEVFNGSELTTQLSDLDESIDLGNLLVLGAQLENSYSVENMQRALESLRKSSKSVLVNDYEVDTTHYYIKFSPESEKHLDLLSQDRALILYDYPLDRETKIQGNYYVDPDAPSDKPMPFYASVEVDHTLPTSGVPHVMLSHLHIPDDNSDFEYIVARSPVLESFIESLVDESLVLTGNKEQVTSSPGARSRSWSPSSKIQTYDDILKRVVGIEGIEVRARRWFTTHTGITSSSGSFSVSGTFKKPSKLFVQI